MKDKNSGKWGGGSKHDVIRMKSGSWGRREGKYRKKFGSGDAYKNDEEVA